MNFFSFSFLFAVFFVAVAFAIPSAEDNFDSFDGNDVEYTPTVQEDAPAPLPRVTCDLLSFGGKVGHAACAAHCILKRYKGGYCDSKGVCHCRR